LTLASLLALTRSQRVTGLKIDVEGAEAIILRQLPALPPSLLPLSIMFEYGGGDDRQTGEKGWSPKFLAATVECLGILKNCGYAHALIVDSQAEMAIFNLTHDLLSTEQLFPGNANYGNIIVFHSSSNISGPNLVTISMRYAGGELRDLVPNL
jgi:hypothetical protein